MDLGLKGRAAAIAAASRGLGRATAQALAAEGCSVALCGRDEARVREAAEQIARATGARTLAVKADVGVAADCHAFVTRAAEAFGRLDVLVTNTGGPRPGGFEAVGDEGWEEAYRVTLANVVHLVRAAIPHMRPRRWGRIVNISSISGVRASAGRIAYGTSKAAIIGLTRQLAIELAPDNITVNSVAPGPVDTATARAVHTELTRRSYARLIPMRRFWEAGGNRRRSVLSLLRGRVVLHRSHDSGRRWLSRGRCP